MNSLCINMIQKNKIVFFILLLVFSLLSVYMPYSLVETNEHHDYESMYKNVINNSKPLSNLRKLIQKLRAFFSKIFKLAYILSSITVLVNTRLDLLNMLFSKVSILHLFSVLCFYFNVGKYKQSIKHSDLLPLMGV